MLVWLAWFPWQNRDDQAKDGTRDESRQAGILLARWAYLPELLSVALTLERAVGEGIAPEQASWIKWLQHAAAFDWLALLARIGATMLNPIDKRALYPAQGGCLAHPGH